MKRNFKPFFLTALIILLDQVTKALVVKHIPVNTVYGSYFSDFLRIVHVRNNAVAFSIGSGLPYVLKVVLFTLIPLLVLFFLAVYMVKADKKELSTFERYLIAAIIGGGCGNIIDRIFRSMSVVDFISTNNYGLFGMDRFPTYNVADASVVVAVVLFLISLLFGRKVEKGEQEET